jgi:Holliday junction resolvase RusA-like endonuclease
MKDIRFTVPGEPVAKARPRVCRVRGFARTFTPARTVRFEQHVRNCAMLADVKPLSGPIEARLVFWFECPATAHSKRTPRPAEPKITPPDVDNAAKSVLDALNGVAYADDKQVCRIVAEKWVAAQGEAARTEVELKPITTTTHKEKQ